MNTIQPTIGKRPSNGILIEGTKELRGRGYYYDYVVIRPDGQLQIGSEEGNYAGGTWLSPGADNYEKRKESFLKNAKKNDPEFYRLIQIYLGNEPKRVVHIKKEEE